MAEKKKKYVAIDDFKDLQDGNKVYFKGDSYPKPANKNIPEERLEELLSSDNKRGRAVIKEVEVQNQEPDKVQEPETAKGPPEVKAETKK